MTQQLVLSKENMIEVYEKLNNFKIPLNCAQEWDALSNLESMIIRDGGIRANGIFYPMGQ